VIILCVIRQASDPENARLSNLSDLQSKQVRVGSKVLTFFIYNLEGSVVLRDSDAWSHATVEVLGIQRNGALRRVENQATSGFANACNIFGARAIKRSSEEMHREIASLRGAQGSPKWP
jgi:hypothetical protein